MAVGGTFAGKQIDVPGSNRNGGEMQDRALLAVLLCYQGDRLISQACCCV